MFNVSIPSIWDGWQLYACARGSSVLLGYCVSVAYGGFFFNGIVLLEKLEGCVFRFPRLSGHDDFAR